MQQKAFYKMLMKKLQKSLKAENQKCLVDAYSILLYYSLSNENNDRPYIIKLKIYQNNHDSQFSSTLMVLQ